MIYIVSGSKRDAQMYAEANDINVADVVYVTRASDLHGRYFNHDEDKIVMFEGHTLISDELWDAWEWFYNGFN